MKQVELRRMFSLLMALTLILVMAFPVFAEDPPGSTLTMSNPITVKDGMGFYQNAHVDGMVEGYSNGNYPSFCANINWTISSSNTYYADITRYTGNSQVQYVLTHAPMGTDDEKAIVQEVVWKLLHGDAYTISRSDAATLYDDIIDNGRAGLAPLKDVYLAVPTGIVISGGPEIQPVFILVDVPPQPRMTVSKKLEESGIASYPRGGIVSFEFTIVNTGNVPLQDIEVRDPMLGIGGQEPIAYLKVWDMLDIGQSITWVWTYNILIDEASDSLTNTVFARYSYGGAFSSEQEASVSFDVFSPMIQGYKYAFPLGEVIAGDSGSNHREGWRIELYKASDMVPSGEENGDFELVDVTYTDANGYYAFDKGIVPGSFYRITENVLPAASVVEGIMGYDKALMYRDINQSRYDSWFQFKLGWVYTRDIEDDTMYDFDHFVYVDAFGDLNDCSFDFYNAESPYVTITKASSDKNTVFEYTMVPVNPWDYGQEDALMPVETEGTTIRRSIRADEVHKLFPVHPNMYLDGYSISGDVRYFNPLSEANRVLEYPGMYLFEEVHPGALFNDPIYEGTIAVDGVECVFFGSPNMMRFSDWKYPDWFENPEQYWSDTPYVIVTNTLKPIIPVVPDPDPDPDPDPNPDPDPDPVGPVGTVTVNHVDTFGNALASSFSFTGTVGTAYGTSERFFEGYALVVSPENASGVFIDGTIVVTYVYGDGVIIDEEVEVIPLGPAIVPEEPEEGEPILELPIEDVPLGDALPVTGHLPISYYVGLGSLVGAIGIYLKKRR